MFARSRMILYVSAKKNMQKYFKTDVECEDFLADLYLTGVEEKPRLFMQHNVMTFASVEMQMSSVEWKYCSEAVSCMNNDCTGG